MSKRSIIRASTAAVTATAMALTVAVATGGAARAHEPAPADVAAGAATYTVFPVPTSAAGLGDIVTAPNGDMWFTMSNANKVGKITPAGAITEYPLPATTTGEPTGVKDLTVAADGTVWVVFDHGRKIVGATPDGGSLGPHVLGRFPYGEQVEMGVDGLPWVTMGFDYDGIVRVPADGDVTWHDNAPPCDGALAKGSDGVMWCVDGDSLIRVNADASGGVTYPMPPGASYPYSLAAGPVGSIWFARYFSGTWYTPANRGDVGWIDAATGAVNLINTGDNTAPFSLTPRPDGYMWFTNRGTEPAIGHVNAQGQGAIAKVGDYQPHHLTFDNQGFIWFTDAKYNSIVKVDPGSLETTDIDPGAGSVFVQDPSVPPVIPPTTPPAKSVGKVKVGKRPLVVRKNKVRLAIVCPKSAKSACRGVAMLRHKKKAKIYTKAVSYKVGPGKRKSVTLKVKKAGKRAFKKGRTVKVRASLIARDGATARDKSVRVRRR